MVPPPAATLRYWYTFALRALGLGHHKEHGGGSISGWTRYQLDWIDTYTVYRDRGQILKAFGALFAVELVEADYIRFRLRASGTTSAFADVVRLPLIRGLGSELFRRLAGLVLSATKL